MVNRGLLVRVKAKAGKGADVERFLQSALPLVREEAGTTAWFAVRAGHSEYGIFDVFPGEAEREAHLNGPVAKALMENADELFAGPPSIQKLDVLADKLPAAAPTGADTKGVLLTFKAKTGHDLEVERFLRDAQPLVEAEPATTAWFAVRLDDGRYGIFDVFPDEAGRLKHLAGRVPRELTKHAFSLLGSVPAPHMLSVQAEKFELTYRAAA